MMTKKMNKRKNSRNLVMMSDLTLFHVKLTFIATWWWSTVEYAHIIRTKMDSKNSITSLFLHNIQRFRHRISLIINKIINIIIIIVVVVIIIMQNLVITSIPLPPLAQCVRYLVSLLFLFVQLWLWFAFHFFNPSYCWNLLVCARNCGFVVFNTN